jgi:outer membrane protein OmpA-like peptidoglycan-associated protein
LEKITRSIIRKDSVGSIRTEGLVGAKFVEISFGSNESPLVQDGDMIGSEPPLDFSDLLKKTDAILDSTGSLTSNLDATAQNLNAISAKINQGHGSLGALVNDRNIYNELNATTAEAAAGAASFKDNMQALQHNFLLRGFFKKRGYGDATELTAHSIDALPQESPIKKFTYDEKQIFGKPDAVKLKSPKTLDEAGKFLEANKFGAAVVVGYTDSKGDSEKDKTLTEARAMVVRDYLVKNFKMDDTMVKTMGLGKNAAAGTEDASRVEILIYPLGANVRFARTSEAPNHR